jgi:glycerol-3-phosphate dehydrogenase (NAD(P)+)
MSDGAQFRPSVGVVGAGRFGLAMAQTAARSGCSVMLYSSLPERAETLRATRALPSILPELGELHSNVVVTNDPAELAANCSMILLTASSEYFLPILKTLGDHLDGAHSVLHAVHALNGPTLVRTSELVMQYTCVRTIGVMAGPTHVTELLSELPNAMVVGSAFPRLVESAQQALQSDHLQVFGNKDFVGVELAAALGQVIAIAVGISDGLNLGAANHAVILSRGLSEMAEAGAGAGANPRTFSGLAGIGRLVDTIRRGEPNYLLGVELATAQSPEAAVAAAPPEALGVAVLKALEANEVFSEREIPIVGTLRAITNGTLSARDGILSYLRGHRAYE